jgi:AraC-like DNA-binding protein/quercetin dioxygenase-like cupin family protein
MKRKADWAHRPKVILQLDVPGMPGILQLGRYNQVEAHEALGDHKHEGAVEICLLLRGRQTYVVKGRAYEMKGGDVFVTLPGEVHSTGKRPQEKGILYWLILSLPRRGGRPFPGPGGEGLARALRALPRRHFAGDWRLRAHCDAIMNLQLGPPSPLRSLALWNHVVGFLLGVVERASAGDPGRGRASLIPVLDHIERHLDEPLPLASLAARAGLSLPRFKSRFSEELGVPPAEYVMRARVARAEALLRTTSLPITRIAYDLGFSSSQYFATVVKRYTLRSPSALRAGVAG